MHTALGCSGALSAVAAVEDKSAHMCAVRCELGDARLEQRLHRQAGQCRKGPPRSAAGVPRPNPQRTGLVCRERDAAAGRPPHLLARKLGRRGRRGILALEQPRLERKLLLLKDKTAAAPIGNRSRRRIR